MENKHLHKAIVIWTNLCRFLLAGTFLFSGFIKANDPLGTVYKVQDYLEAWGLFSFSSGMFPYAVALGMGILEFIIGIYLFFGIRRRFAPFFTLILMSFMTLLTLWLAIDNPISDCGCFGDAIILTNWETFFKNIVLLIAAISVFKWSKHQFKLVTGKVDWLISLYSTVFIIFFSLFCLRYLPVFDFRPYHIGADIQKGMEIPEGEKPTSYETLFTYQKDGERKEFTINNLPSDTTWIFVESRTIIKEKGYEPPIQNFGITSIEDGSDLTDEILNDSNYTFLLVAPWLSQADDSGMDLINEVYDYSVEHGYRFYCLTASYEDDIAMWQENTGAEYPFAQTDDITLKTMIRSNPGLMLLKKGVILNKWSVSNLPDEYQLSAPLDQLALSKLNPKSTMHKLLEVFIWFVAPLLVLTIGDLVWLNIRSRNTKKKEKEKKQQTI